MNDKQKDNYLDSQSSHLSKQPIKNGEAIKASDIRARVFDLIHTD